MINESQLTYILQIPNNKIINNKTLFGSPLKKFINNIYHTVDIPTESFIISLFYLCKFYNALKAEKAEKVKNEYIIDTIMKDFYDNLNLYIFSGIIISLKHIYDDTIHVKDFCVLLNINYDKYIQTELILLNIIDWNTSYENDEYSFFKKSMAHYMD